MRFLHTSDWHLGRALFQVKLLEDQAYVLDKLVDVIKDTSVDAVIIAGDVFDRAQPPREALSLLDDTLTRIVVDLGVPVIMIAGNHDGLELIEFGNRITSKNNFFSSGLIASSLEAITLEDKWGSVHFYPIPYAEPAVVQERLGYESGDGGGHDQAMAAIIENISQTRPKTERSVAIAHAFVEGGLETKSERPLSVGGTGTVHASKFVGFDYVALGHLHRPQHAGSETVRYSGSLLKYSVSEVDHQKSVSLVDIDQRGDVRTEEILLTPKRDLRVLEGDFDDFLTGPLQAPRDDYLQINLLDREPIMDAMSRLRDVYPNLLHINRIPQHQQTNAPLSGRDHREISTLELFQSFFDYTTGEEIDDKQTKVIAGVIEAVEGGRA